MYKSNLKYKSNLYVLKEDFRHNDKEFFSKIDDPDLLYFYKYKKQLSDNCFSDIQKQIIAERSICSNLKYPDPCWGKKGDDYICKCVNIDCKELDSCRKNIPLEDEEFKNFSPEKNAPIDYEYRGVAKNVFYYPVKTSFADEYDSYNPVEEVPYEEYEQIINTDNDSVIWVDSPELVNIQDLNNDDEVKIDDTYEYEEDDKVPDISFEQQDGEYRVVEQGEIIEADLNESFLVNAGPGTGKTYTLIHKINHLIMLGEDEDSDFDIDSGNIYVLSFTRAAVKEIQERLVKANKIYGIQSSVNNVNLRTFDSFIYYLINRAKEIYTDISINTSFDSYLKSRETAIEILKKHPDILKTFEMKYFIVDEIQDLTNSLAHFVLEILFACKKQNIPFSLFGDTCQAIYDYNKEKDLQMTSSEFYKKAKDLFDNNKNFVELKGNKRQSEYLTELSIDYREAILKEDIDKLKKELRYIGNGIDTRSVNDMKDYDQKDFSSAAILTRSNGQAFDYASKLRLNGIPYVLDSKNQNIKNNFVYAPWIAKVFYDYKNEKMYLDDFENIVYNKGIEIPEINYNENGKNSIKIFWEYLTKSTNELVVKDFLNELYTHKFNNQVTKFIPRTAKMKVSTIHRAKGREFDQVYVVRDFYNDVTGLSGDKRNPENRIDEHRVMYVALTRPKTKLSLISLEQSSKSYKIKDESIEVWCKGPKENPDCISIMDDCIDYDQFDVVSERVRQKISYNTEIRLTDSSIEKEKYGRYHIKCIINNKSAEIGMMDIKFSNIIKSNFFKKEQKSKNRPEFYPIKNLYVDKIFTYLKKDNDGIITPVTGVTFTGFGRFIK